MSLPLSHAAAMGLRVRGAPRRNPERHHHKRGRPDFVAAGLDVLAIAYSRQVERLAVTDAKVSAHIERLTTAAERQIQLARASATDADVRDLANQPPVVRYVNLLVRDAYDAGASDIHLEATRSGLAARFRLDGVLSRPIPSKLD